MNKSIILKKNLFLGFFFKISSLFLSFISVPLVLNYLGVENYGIWVVIFSVANWIYNFDMGIGNGLRNKLTISMANFNYKVSSQYLSTAFFIISFVALIIFALFLSLINLLDLRVFFPNVDDLMQLNKAIIISIIFTVLNFVLNIYRQLYYADQKSALVAFSLILTQVFILVGLIVVGPYFSPSLSIVSFLFGASNAVVRIVFLVVFLKKKKYISISFSNFSMELITPILSIGGKFFIIQICMIFLFTTDNLIISSFFTSKDVATYNVALKIYMLFITIASVVLSPFWSLFTDSYNNGDCEWIKRKMKLLHIYFIVLILLLSVFYYFADAVIYYWIGRNLSIDSSLYVVMSIFVILKVYAEIHITFLNAISKINMQMWLYIIGAIFNVPLSFLFVKYTDWGFSGVLISTNVFLFLFVVFLPVQTYNILYRKC